MNKRLRILHLEDEPDFAELVCSLLNQDQLAVDVKRVSDRLAFVQALDAGGLDLIISDYHLPSFTGLEALGLAKKKCPHTPFILVSGTIGEQAAIESLRAGATDYVLKQTPDRLPSAIRRAVQEAAERTRLRAAETELIRREKYFRTLTENSLDVVTILDREGIYTYVSPSVERVMGYAPREMLGQKTFDRMHPDDVPQVVKAFQSVLQDSGEPVRIQYRYRHKEGGWYHHEAHCQNRFDDPDIGGLVTHCRDVTDRWQAEEGLRDSERQYRLLFHSNPNPMWVFDLESLKFLEVNEAAIRQYGYSREEFLELTFKDVRAPEKNDQHKKVVPETTEHGVIWRHRRKDGSYLDAEVVWSPMAFRNHFSALAMATNVTERRQAERRNTIFSKLSQRLSSATTVAEAAMIICEAADGLFKWSDFALDLYFAETDEVFSLLNITTVDGQRVEIPPSLQPKTANALIRRVVNRGAELISSEETKDQSGATMLAPILKGTKVIGVLLIQNPSPGAFASRDLEMLQTLAGQSGGALERVRAEDELRRTQERFHDLFDNSPDAIFVEDMNGKVLDVNFAACVLHGMTREQMLGKNSLDDLLPPGSRDAARRDFQKLTEGKLTWIESESLMADGRVIPVEVRASRIEYDSKPALLLHVRDITQRRAAETALQSSEMLFRSVWENSVDGMRLTDDKGVIIAVNDAFCQLVGMEASRLEGQLFTVVYAKTENQEEMVSRHRNRFVTRSTPEQKSERKNELHNGQTVMLEVTHSFVEVHGRTMLMLSLFRDVTLQRRLEEQLRQSQKMEAIGQLAGGVAHDFNNILTVIHGHASLLGMADLSQPGARSAQQIIQAAERAAGLTRQLLAFSRRQLIQPKRLDMNGTVGHMTDMLGRLLGEDVALQLNYSPTPATVEADAGMMEQVLLNLAVNARDAMPRGGQLAIRIAVVDVDQAHVQHQPEARVGRFVCVSKTDTGCGIPSENLPRIFEPFFTTKDIGKGTGLGLATVYGIVKQHQGWIEVESTLGKGTTFRIYIPFVGSTLEVEKPAAPVTVRGGSETILLVEDESPVRELVANVLQNYGYKILQAGSGHEAVGVWREHKTKINLLLTDLVMPGNMNGHELAEKFQSEQSGLKVIFTSGYSADIVGKNFKLDASLNFLQKPYHPNTLALTVRRCLDGKDN